MKIMRNYLQDWEIPVANLKDRHRRHLVVVRHHQIQRRLPMAGGVDVGGNSYGT